MKKFLVYLFMLGMLISPVLCLISTLQAAPTPAHRAEVEAQAPNPAADWTVTALAAGAVVVVGVVVLLKSGQRVDLGGGWASGPEIVRPAAPGPLAPEAQNHWISDLPLAEAGHNGPWKRG